MGSELDTSLWHVLEQRQPAASWLREWGHGPQTEGRDCPPAHHAPQSTTRDDVQSWPQHSKCLEELGGGGLRGLSLVVGLEHFFPEAEGAGLVQPRDRTDLEASN